MSLPNSIKSRTTRSKFQSNRLWLYAKASNR